MKTGGAVVQMMLITLLGGLLWTACQTDTKPSPKPPPPEAILGLDVKCLQPQRNSTILRTQQNQMHFISQHHLEIRKAVEPGEFEYTTVHEVLDPSGKVIHSETLKSQLKVEGAAESRSEFDFPWQLPTDLVPGKYQYRIQAIITELLSQTKQTQQAKKIANTIDFFIK